jgi:uncharacterized protein (TIGR02996 family)
MLAAVLERFEDSGARQVYADWLAGGGDPRGELIVLWARWAAGRADPSQVRRIKRLRNELVAAFKERRGYKAMGVDVEHGFVVGVTARLDWVLQHGAQLLRSEPVRSISLVSAKPATLMELASVPGVGGLSWLSVGARKSLLSAFPIGADWRPRLVVNPKLSELKTLMQLPQAKLIRGLFTRTGYSAESLVEITKAPELAQVEWLGWLVPGWLDEAWLSSLPWKLRHLDLRMAGSVFHARRVTEGTLEALIANPALGGLKRLDLTATAIDDRGVAVLATAPWSLRVLDVSGCSHLTEQGIGVLRERFGTAVVVDDDILPPMT